MSDSLERMYVQLYEAVRQQVDQMPFYQELHQRIEQLRVISGLLTKALNVTEGLHEGTIRVIKDAKTHVDEELQAATEIWNDRLS